MDQNSEVGWRYAKDLADLTGFHGLHFPEDESQTLLARNAFHAIVDVLSNFTPVNRHICGLWRPGPRSVSVKPAAIDLLQAIELSTATSLAAKLQNLAVKIPNSHVRTRERPSNSGIFSIKVANAD